MRKALPGLTVLAAILAAGCQKEGAPTAPDPTPTAAPTATPAPTARPTAANQPPVLGIKVTPSSMSGPAPLTVTINMCFCSDPEFDDLTYEFHYSQTQKHFSTFCREDHVYNTPGRYAAWFCVSDGHNESVCENYTVDVQ
jgi:hypothetical protein